MPYFNTSKFKGPKMPGTLRSDFHVEPCYQDLVTFVIGHDNYPGDRPILIDAADENNHITRNYARTFVRSTISAFRDLGIGPGDVVCLHMFNNILLPLVYLAVVGCGASVTAANPVYTAAELRHHFEISKTTLVITTDAQIEVAKQATKGVKSLTKSCNGCLVLISDLVIHVDNGFAEDWVRFDDSDRSKTTIACLNTTSGTTGLPKMAARSHFSLVMENLAIEDKQQKPYSVRRLLCTPFFHGFTLPLAIVSALRCGHPTYVMARFDRTTFLRAISNFNITETAMPPPLLVQFLAEDPSTRTELQCLRLVWSGGAPMAADTQARAARMFANDGRICQVWGMTEGAWMTTFQYPEADNSGSVGRLMATYEAKIVPISGSIPEAPSATRTTGEIWIRGPMNMLGYFKNPAATKATFADGEWLRTGDVGYITADGRIFIVDRVKELMKVRGWQVAPAELESRLIAHPSIIEAGVIGIPKPEEASEVPRAYVVLSRKDSLTEEDVKTYLLKGLAKYKVKDCQVRFTDSIPKSASGKILRKILRQQASDEVQHL